MNDFGFNFLTFAYLYSSIVVGIGIAILGKILPKIVKEGRIKDSLYEFRHYLLAAGLALFILGIVTFIILTGRFYLPQAWLRTAFLSLLMIFSTMYLITAVSKYKIYTFQYKQQHGDTPLQGDVDIQELKDMKDDVKATKKTVAVSAKDIKEVKVDVKIIKKNK